MENIIAKLLSDFERGFLNRRQLIQSLALAATAANALAQNPASQAPAAAAPSTPAKPAHPPAFMTMELDHISFQVTDYRVTRDFYADLMGMDVKNDNGRNQCELHFGNSMIIARNHYGGRRGPDGSTAAAGAAPAQTTPPAAAPATAGAGGGGGRGNRPPSTALVDHIAYRIYSWDTDQIKEELIRRGLATATSRPDTGGGTIPNYSSFHVMDPDHFDLQISGWAGPKDSVNKKG